MAPKTVGEKLRLWAEKTTIHAIPNITTTERNLVRVIWIICLLASSGYCGYLVIQSLIDYLKFEVNTVYAIERETDTDFPTISICNINPCGFDDFNHDLYLNKTISELEEKLNLTYQSELHNIRKVTNLLEEAYLKNLNKSDLLRMLRVNETSIKSILINCKYDNEVCSELDFFPFNINQYQKCFKFNSGKNFLREKIPIRKSLRYGKKYGLSLELYLGDQRKCKSPIGSSYGIFIYVHNSTYKVSEDNSAVLLSPGFETDVATDRVFVRKMRDPYSNCVPNTENFDWANKMVEDTFKTTPSYTQQSCLQICYQKYLVEKFNCFDDYLPFFKGSTTRPCPTILDSFNNSLNYYKESYFNESQDDKCLDLCPIECEYFNYRTSMSNLEFPSEGYMDVLVQKLNNTDRESIKSGVMAVNIYYKSDSMTLISENAKMEFGVFISNFGGTLGLFLGMSILSLVEIADFIFETILILVENNKANVPKQKVAHINVASKMDHKSSNNQVSEVK